MLTDPTTTTRPAQTQITLAVVGILTILVGMFAFDWFRPSVYDGTAVKRCVDDAVARGEGPQGLDTLCLVPANEHRVTFSLGDLRRLSGPQDSDRHGIPGTGNGVNGWTDLYLRHGLYLSLIVMLAALALALARPSRAAPGLAGIAELGSLAWLTASTLDLGRADRTAVQPGPYVTGLGHLWLLGFVLFAMAAARHAGGARRASSRFSMSGR